MKERGILFSGPMIRAIPSGAKTQTRRIVKPQPPANCDTPLFDPSGRGWFFDGLDEDGDCMEAYPDDDTGLLCPYGKPGDRLWVRETWRAEARYDHLAPSKIPRSSDIWYEADEALGMAYGKLRPSIFMPRWASRISLEITGVRVERVNEISEEDARAEGVGLEGREVGMHGYGSYAESFAHLWDSLNKARGYGFDTGCWVWAISFRRI